MGHTAAKTFGQNLKRLALSLGTVAALGFFGFLAYRILIGGLPTTWHQRLTVVIDTPQGEVRSVAVTEVTNREDDGLLQLPQTSGIRATLHGEAVVVEVMPGKYLFVLLDGAESWAMRAFRLNDQTDPKDRTNRAVMTRLHDLPLDVPADLPPDAYPLLVTFTDITKPKTVLRLDPAKLADAFGPRVNLASVKLEITSEQITTGRVESVLGWLKDIWPNNLNGGSLFMLAEPNNPPASYLSANSFSTEIEK